MELPWHLPWHLSWRDRCHSDATHEIPYEEPSGADLGGKVVDEKSLNFPPTPGSLLDAMRLNPHDSELMTRLIDFTRPYLEHWARRFLTDAEDREDFLQEVYVKLVRLIPRFKYDRTKRFRGLLRVIAQNTMNDFRRKKKRDPVNGLSSLDIPVESEVSRFDEREYNAFLVKRAMEVMKSEFSDQDWQTVYALIIEGKSAKEVAKQFNRTIASVYMAKFRVLKRLREMLQGLMD